MMMKITVCVLLMLLCVQWTANAKKLCTCCKRKNRCAALDRSRYPSDDYHITAATGKLVPWALRGSKEPFQPAHDFSYTINTKGSNSDQGPISKICKFCLKFEYCSKVTVTFYESDMSVPTPKILKKTVDQSSEGSKMKICLKQKDIKFKVERIVIHCEKSSGTPYAEMKKLVLDACKKQ